MKNLGWFKKLDQKREMYRGSVFRAVAMVFFTEFLQVFLIAFFMASPIVIMIPEARSEDAPAAGSNPKKGKYQRSKLTSDETEALADKRRLLLTTGENKTVDIDFDTSNEQKYMIVGNPQVVLPTVVRQGDRRQLIFTPLKAGETTVNVRDMEGNLRVIFTVRVTGSNLLRVAGELRDLLKDIEGLEIRIVGSKIIVDGEILVPADYGRMISVIQDKAYADLVLNLSVLAPLALQVLSKKIQEEIRAFAPNVSTRVVNGVIFLEGSVDNPDQANRSIKVALYYLPELRPGDPLEKDPGLRRNVFQGRGLVQSFIVVNPPPPKKAEKLVRVTVHFVELSKGYNKAFGFKWEPGFTSDPTIQIGTDQSGAAGATGSTFSATISSLLPKLQSAQNAGYARIIKTGTVVVRSGQPAKIVEQQEIPYTQTGPNGQSTTAKQNVGLSMAVTPTVLGQSEDIQMDLEMDQTNLVDKTKGSTSNAPEVAVHKVQTKVYVRSSESAAVAGVDSATIQTAFNKDDPNPGTLSGQTSPLFSMLRSKAYSKKKSQFVVFVTPQIIENASDGTEDLKKNFRIKVK